MRILHVAKEFDPQGGGVARHIDGLARATAGPKLAVTVFAPGATQDGPAPYAVIGKGLRRAVQEADIVHLHGSRSGIVAYAVALARLFGRASLYTPHCYYDHGSPLKRAAKRLWDRTVERTIAANASATILLDESWKADFAARGLRSRHTAIVPNCVLESGLSARRPAGSVEKLAGTPALISIGRLDPVKRLDDAIALLARPGLEEGVLHVVGRGSDQARLAARADALGVAGRVVFHGPLPDMAAAAALAGSDAFLLCSEREGLPTVLIESLLSGIPVVASDIPANRAVARAIGWNGLYPLGDLSALAACTREWAGRPVDTAVQASLRRLFTWEARAGEIEALYRRALEPH